MTNSNPATKLNSATLKKVLDLVFDYAAEVTLYTIADTARPQYHARAAKLGALIILVDAGLSPTEAVEQFQTLLKRVDSTVYSAELLASKGSKND